MIKKILFIITAMFPSFIKAEGLDDKINEWFEPIADAWVNIVLYPINFSNEISTFLKSFHSLKSFLCT